jgi:hypothetical protein
LPFWWHIYERVGFEDICAMVPSDDFELFDFDPGRQIDVTRNEYVFVTMFLV